MPAKNDITGDNIQSKPTTDKYRENFPEVGRNKSVVGCFVERSATLEEWKYKAESLWALLDDIDTFGDFYKPEHTEYFKAVDMKSRERHKILQSDGYKIINT